MSVKDFLIGAGTMLVGVALGVAVCCAVNCGKCGKKGDKPMPPCPMEQQCQRPDGPHHFNGGPEGPCAKMGKEFPCAKMAQELQLTEDQLAQIEAANAEQREAKKAAKEKFDETFQSILTDEQKAQLEKIKAEKCKKHEGPKPCEGKPDFPKDKPQGHHGPQGPQPE